MADSGFFPMSTGRYSIMLATRKTELHQLAEVLYCCAPIKAMNIIFYKIARFVFKASNNLKARKREIGENFRNQGPETRWH